MVKNRIEQVQTYSDMPTSVLNMASDDEKRTEMLIAMNKKGEAFREMQDTIDADHAPVIGKSVGFEFDDPKIAKKALGMLRYDRLNEIKADAGPIHRRLILAEQIIERVLNPDVRWGIKKGFIQK